MLNPDIVDKIREHIENQEYFHHGMKWVNGGDAKITWIEIEPDTDSVMYDIEFFYDGEGRSEKYSNCRMSLKWVLGEMGLTLEDLGDDDIDGFF